MIGEPSLASVAVNPGKRMMVACVVVFFPGEDGSSSPAL